LPPKNINVDTLEFDDNHTNAERGHGVTENEAKQFVT
jgi:hypothetical protein